MNGMIVKGIGGFYYVDTAEGVIECKARGRFRQTVGKPVIGDRVVLERQPDGTGFVTEILPRRNELIRPAVANLDLLVVVVSAAPPVTEPFLIDKMTVIAQYKDIACMVAINKTDLDAGDALYDLYRGTGIATLRVSAETGEGIDEMQQAIAGKTAAFAGNSGVGKSSVLNRLDPSFSAEVGSISDRIGRGKHTTRHVELRKTAFGGYIADTPGFSSFETERMDLVRSSELAQCFPEFAPFLGQCRFTGCSHCCEAGCAVMAAVERGEIAQSRFASYKKLYDSVKDRKEWEYGKNGKR